MVRKTNPTNNLSELLSYLATDECSDNDRLLSLGDLSREIGLSIATLREQLEVARTLGLVEVRPRTGIRRLKYSFKPAVRQSLAYALAVDQNTFQKYYDLRNHLELAYWMEAVSLLTDEDKKSLSLLTQRALARLLDNPLQVPHEEHRTLHLSIYKRLNNPFVIGLLEAYWEAYESIGLNVYTDIEYLNLVWQYHHQMVEKIIEGDYNSGLRLLREHIQLIHHRSQPLPKSAFE